MNKSPRRAIVLSLAAVLAFTLTSAILNLALPYLLTGDIRTVVADPGSLSRPADMAALLAILLAVLLALTGLGAYWLYRFFSPAYFGQRSLPRWALFGVLFALLIKLPDWLLPQSWWLLKDIILFLDVFLAFFIARWAFPPDRNL